MISIGVSPSVVGAEGLAATSALSNESTENSGARSRCTDGLGSERYWTTIVLLTVTCSPEKAGTLARRIVLAMQPPVGVPEKGGP